MLAAPNAVRMLRGRRSSVRCSSGHCVAAIPRCLPRVVQGVPRPLFHLFSSHCSSCHLDIAAAALSTTPHLTSPPLPLPLTGVS